MSAIPPPYPQMLHREIMALPKEERRAAFRCNPQATTSHVDCRCPVCDHRYAADVQMRFRYRVQCPRCNDGRLLRASNEEEYRTHWARLRAMGEQRLFSILTPRRATVVRYDDLLPVWQEVA